MGQTVSSASSSASKLLRLVIPRRYASSMDCGYGKMNNQDDSFHLQIHPQELQFPFELKKQISCDLQLSNKSDNCVAFKVKTTNPKRYCVKPNHGVVLPRSTCDVIVIMQAQKETPSDMQCEDKFLIQNVVAKMGTTRKDITSEMFDKKPGSKVEECKLSVIYVEPSQPSFTIQEESDEYFSSRSSIFSDQTNAVISKLTKERDNALEQNKRLEQELV
ncbi:unnamed protein product [Lathyrus sativus]|nr:unnamed protein product [Lathyrus sativus]